MWLGTLLLVLLLLVELGSASLSQSVSSHFIKANVKEQTQSAPPVDSSLYSRQLLVYGESAQLKLRDAHVLVIGNASLASEVVKNLALSGIGSLSLRSESGSVQRQSRPSGNSITGHNTSLLEYVQAINRNVQVSQAASADRTLAAVMTKAHVYPQVQSFPSPGEENLLLNQSLASANLTAIVATDLDMLTLSMLDSICREINVPLVAVSLIGSTGFVFNDFHRKFLVTDADGDETKEVGQSVAFSQSHCWC
jgi:hypothetical protein